ncbi:HNH endonuclease [Frigidibacter sp. RF13]|uniref:HNH endonuclease n=1 Tax=Frigidibacter sp. RF13 TaxID=2997340 RepID=UPI002270304B|nr:HNH endonuclease [Frigidibacter sp. RF13]MCY1126025.1 HNH endonuclease [Frigidibacter sp. RF13]
MGVNRWTRHSAPIIRTKRWKRLRYEALRRDGFACVSCGARGRLEVDHREPVRTAPERSFDLTNLQSLCVACHARKTRAEIGMGETDPARMAWKTLVRKTGRETEQ